MTFRGNRNHSQPDLISNMNHKMKVLISNFGLKDAIKGT